MVKIRQKVSGCLRTLTGAEQFCAIRSYLATIAKHGIDLLDALTPPHQPTPLAALRSLNFNTRDSQTADQSHGNVRICARLWTSA
jgi:hypothetical protein